MHDKELLELAAGGAALTLEESIYPGWFMCHGRQWNPLVDDGDALRLAVQLDLTFQSLAENKTIEAWHHGDLCWEPWGHDKFAATHRAIVRAAAEIGKNAKRAASAG